MLRYSNWLPDSRPGGARALLLSDGRAKGEDRSLSSDRKARVISWRSRPDHAHVCGFRPIARLGPLIVRKAVSVFENSRSSR
jgi:hypothetical protein